MTDKTADFRKRDTPMNAKIDTNGMKQAYVIGPISSYEDQEWNIAAFNRCRAKVMGLLGLDCKIPQDFIPDDIPYEDMMTLSFGFIENEVDIIIRLDDPMPSSGADREVEYASALGIPVIHETDLREENIAMNHEEHNNEIVEGIQNAALRGYINDAIGMAGGEECFLEEDSISEFDEACQSVVAGTTTLATLCVNFGIDLEPDEDLEDAIAQWVNVNSLEGELWYWDEED